MTSAFEFDQSIAVTRQDVGRYTADLDGGWIVGGGVNGGYQMALIGNAISDSLADSGHRDPFAFSSYFLSAGRPGPATITIETKRSGRGTTTVAATLSQEQGGVSVDRITALATYGDLGRMRGDVRTTATPPELPPVEECVLTSTAPDDFKAFVPMLDRFAMYADPACIGWMAGRPSGNARLQAWFKLADDRPIDANALLMVVDVLPPVTFELGLPGWAPTLELSAHVRAVPAPGLLRIRHESRNFAGGFFEEDCEVWDSTGRLVAQSRQLALQPKVG